MYTVYRIQNRHGEGLYYSDLLYYLFGERHMDAEHPSMLLDFEWMFAEPLQYLCAFPSMDKLHEWFNKEQIDAMRSAGYYIVKFDVPDLFLGKSEKQCIFKKSHLPTTVELLNT